MRIHSFLIEFNSRNLHIGEKGDREFFISCQNDKFWQKIKIQRLHSTFLLFFFFQILTFYMEGRGIICTSCWENKRMHDAAHSHSSL